MDAHDRLALARLADEAAQATGLEVPTRGLVGADDGGGVEGPEHPTNSLSLRPRGRRALQPTASAAARLRHAPENRHPPRNVPSSAR